MNVATRITSSGILYVSHDEFHILDACAALNMFLNFYVIICYSLCNIQRALFVGVLLFIVVYNWLG